jgi:two-component system chemotaxis response regulator CheB
MPRHDVVVLGGSAGSLEPLTTIVNALPVGLKASVLVVMHMRAGPDGVLPDILDRATQLPVAFAKNGDSLRYGHVYVAQPDAHLIVVSGGLRLVHGPRENGFRPAVDPLFRTAARELGSRVVGVILSGGLSDGTYGLSLIKQHGGIAIVQDPAEASVDSMPRNALNAVDADYVLPAAQIAATVTRLIEEPPRTSNSHATHAGSRPHDELEPQLSRENTKVSEMEELFGRASSLTCPDCGGALWEVGDGRVVRYQCHVGHQYAQDALEAEQRESMDSALWTAVRVLEEYAELKKRMAKRAADNGMATVSKGFADGARDADSQAQRIRSLLFVPNNGFGAAEAARRQAGETRPRSARRRQRARKIRPA